MFATGAVNNLSTPYQFSTEYDYEEDDLRHFVYIKITRFSDGQVFYTFPYSKLTELLLTKLT